MEKHLVSIISIKLPYNVTEPTTFEIFSDDGMAKSLCKGSWVVVSNIYYFQIISYKIQTSLPFVNAIRLGSDANLFFEQIVKVGRIFETQTKGDLGDAPVGMPEHYLGLG